MKNEDVLIVGLTMIVLIVGAIAILVTGIGTNVDTAAPFESSTPIKMSNSTNSTIDSSHHDTGISASEVTGQSSSSSNSYSGSGYSNTYSATTTTPSSSDYSESYPSESGSSDSSSSDSGESGQRPSDSTVNNLE